MKQKSIPIYFDDGRMIGIAVVRLHDDGSVGIAGGSDRDPQISVEDMEKIGAIMMLTDQIPKNIRREI